MRNSTVGIQSQCLKRRLLWKNTFLLLNFNFQCGEDLLWEVGAGSKGSVGVKKGSIYNIFNNKGFFLNVSFMETECPSMKDTL